MSEVTFEQVLSEVQSLPPEAQAKLRDILNAAERTQPEKTVAATNGATNGTAKIHDPVREPARAFSLRDLTAERQWLKENCDEYAGQWVALKGNQLISHGMDAKEVHAAAKAAGHPDALLEQVEPCDALSFIF